MPPTRRMPSEYQESDLLLRFGPRWVVHRYDTHPYYQNWSGLGLKGVDFLGILMPDLLVLTEVKNYHQRLQGHKGYNAESIREKPALLADAVARKALDTFLALDAVRQYWQRHWWRRMRWQHLAKKSPKHSERAFWANACALAEHPDCCAVLLWLEGPALDASIRQELTRQISSKLADVCGQIWIAGDGFNPLPEDLFVEYL